VNESNPRKLEIISPKKHPALTVSEMLEDSAASDDARPGRTGGTLVSTNSFSSEVVVGTAVSDSETTPSVVSGSKESVKLSAGGG
jgi:hypothetical protein